MKKAIGIHLTWIVVKDIEKAIKFYTEVAGLELKEYHKEFCWAELAGPEGAILGIGQECQENPMAAGANAVPTISVESIEEAIAHLNKMKAKLIGDVIEVPGHVKMQTFQDADGNLLQLVQQLYSA
jgi:predicted enzyme related to lactoylglutathione lyase